jgi:pheromone shutdown protein TraB
MFLSEDVEADIPPRSGEKIHKERLTEENFQNLMKELKFFDPNRTQVLVSGRERFIESVKSIAKKCKYTNAVEI